jgi:hypothetical protein
MATSIAWSFVAGPIARSQSAYAALDLPDNPTANLQQTNSNSSAPAGSDNPSSQTQPVQSPGAPTTAAGQLKAQEKQRVFGVMATFNTTRNKDALPLSSAQKYQLFFKSATDPWPFLLSSVSAGVDQAQNSFPAYGQGVQGYAKRFGADYTDYFTGNLLGNAVLASLLHEDPRYFQKGTGKASTRALWAAGSTVWCKRDSGSWGPNYANVLGNLMGAAVSNLYYPQADRTAAGTIERGVSVTAEAIVGSEVIEFWPDIVRRHNRKKAEKLARQAGQGGVPNVAKPADGPVPAPPPSEH